MKDLLKGLVFVGLFAIPFIPLLVTDSLFFPFITGKNFSFRIIVEIIFGAWVLLALLDAAYRPRFSWILSGVSLFIIVIFFADLFAQYPPRAFWSNYERMDGFVTLAHFFLYFVVLASSFKQDKKLWFAYLWTTVAAAGYVAFDGFQQFINREGSWRVDSTLGNAAYMAVYMLFHAFFTVYLFIESRQWWTRGIAAILFALFVTVLLLTATRGTFLGLVAGLGITVLYLLIFAKGYPTLRKTALGAIVVLVLAVGGLVAFKDSDFVNNSPALDRFASISMSDLDIRFTIWGMAYEGFQDRPILGWGQGNFNYVFNQYYEPSLYNAESWYDRAHNIGFDWLIAGGVLGLLAYLSIFVALAYYLLWRPFFGGELEDEGRRFSVTERAVLIGLVVAYFTHNLVVFDNIVSYIFFGVTLAFIHSRYGEIMERVENFEIDPRIVTNIAAPVMVVLIGTTVYFVNIPALQAAGDIIDALRAQTIPARLSEMEEALDRGSFAHQEIVEQLAQQAMQIAGNPNIPPEQKQQFVERAEQELLALAAEKPGDARVHIFISGFYRSLGAMERSMEHAEIARSLSPEKQAIMLEQGIIAYQMQDFEAMRDYFREAWELEKDNTQARVFYAASLMYTGERELIDEVITDEYFDRFAANDFALQSANQFGHTELVERIFEFRIEESPQNAQHRASLAFLKYQDGDTEEAIEVLQKAVEEIPSFTDLGTCYIENLEAGDPPEEGCSANGNSSDQNQGTAATAG